MVNQYIKEGWRWYWLEKGSVAHEYPAARDACNAKRTSDLGLNEWNRRGKGIRGCLWLEEGEGEKRKARGASCIQHNWGALGAFQETGVQKQTAARAWAANE